MSIFNVDLTLLAKNFSISNIVAPKSFVGKSIQELDLFNTYDIHCIGHKEEDKIIPVGPDYVIKELDKLLFAGPNKNLEKLAKL